MAGSSVTKTYRPLDKQNVFPNSMELLIEWVADDTDHSVPYTAFSDLSGWKITKITAIPGDGAEAPTGGYDIIFEDTDGLDILDGALQDLSNSDNQSFTLAVPIGFDGFTFKLSNNAVDSATGKLRVFMDR